MMMMMKIMMMMMMKKKKIAMMTMRMAMIQFVVMKARRVMKKSAGAEHMTFLFVEKQCCVCF